MTGSFILAVDSNAESSVRTVLEGRESKLSIAFRLARDFMCRLRKIFQSQKFLCVNIVFHVSNKGSLDSLQLQ